MAFVNTVSRILRGTLLLGLGALLPQLRAQTTITSMSTTTTTGTASTADSHTFDNTVISLNMFSTSAGNTYAVAGLANQAFARRNSVDANQSSVWYAQGSGTDMLGTHYNDYPTLLLSNNLAEGSDNTFANQPTGADTGNIERLDFVFNSALTSASGVGFGVFDRGAAGAHDAFAIAAITGWDFVNNLPTAYGQLVSVAGNWGATNVASSFNYNLFRYNQGDNITSAYQSTETGNQGIGGVFFTMGDLGISPGTKVYGYSLFGYDVTDGGNSANLIDYTNATYFPTNTNNTTGSGGIDLIAANGIAFTLIPEPSTYALIAAGALGAFAIAIRLRRRRAA